MNAHLLRVGPPDLTQLAKKNQGILPMNRLYEVSEGGTVAAHGTRDMPIWGQVYRDESQQQLRGTPFPPEWSVRGRIMALVEYLETLQQR